MDFIANIGNVVVGNGFVTILVYMVKLLVDYFSLVDNWCFIVDN